jgi:hypothetical protein
MQLPARTVLFVTALFAVPSLAERSARLLTDDAPLVAALAPSAAALAMHAADEVAAQHDDRPSFGLHLAKTFPVGVLSSAVGVMVGTLLGPLSNNLIVALLPVALGQLIVPPVLTVLAAMLFGPEGSGFWLPLAPTFVLHAAATVIAWLLLTVSVSNPVSMFLFSVVDGLIMSASSVGMMQLLAKRPPATALPSFVPGVTDTQVASMMKLEF